MQTHNPPAAVMRTLPCMDLGLLSVMGAEQGAELDRVGALEQSGGAQVMRLLLGEGDQYSAYEDIAMDRIVWWDLEADQLVRDLGAGGSQHAEPKLH